MIQRPLTLTDDEKALTLTPPRSKCCRPAPPVIEFDGEGNLIRAWGGPSQRYEWPQNEHGISIDARGFVWIGGNGENDGQYLKLTRTGEFVLQIGKSGPQTNSNDIARLGRPADAEVDPETNEVYIADGYFNHRVIVFDANSGAYKRHWGAYGRKPTDEKLPLYNPAAAPSQQFGNPVHCVKIAKDDLAYICDRSNDRIQVFRKDGTFVKEFMPVHKSWAGMCHERAFALRKNSGHAEALYVCLDPLVYSNATRINALALAARLPVMHGVRENALAGGLMSYGPDFPDMSRRAAEIVDKILRGAKPADIPVEQPTKFDLVLNLTTAKAIGLTIPPQLLAIANEVVE